MKRGGQPIVLQSANPPPPIHGVANVIDMILHSPLLNGKYHFQYLNLRKRSGTQFSERFNFENVYYAVRQTGELIARLFLLRPRIFHVHVTEYWGFRKNMLFIIIAKCLGCKIVVQIHGPRFDTYYDKSSRFERNIIHWVLTLADTVFVLSPMWKEFCSRFLPGDKIEVIPCSVRWEYADVLNQPLPDRSKHSYVNVLYLGSTGARKGVFDLLKVIPSVVTTNPNLRFTIAGREEKAGEEEQMQAIIREKGLSQWITRLCPTQEEILGVYFDADIYVLPTHADAFPQAVLEAMSMGLPVITTRVGGISEMVEEGKGAVLIEPGDLDALKKEILRLAASPDLRAEMGLANRERVRQYFTPLIVSELVDRVYAHLIE
jgi:glycosyltransferase involved in cell wall biosynthesis